MAKKKKVEIESVVLEDGLASKLNSRLQKKTTVGDLCQGCSLRKSKERNYVATEASVGAHVLFIGEAPGEEEVKEKRPFVGASGKLLRDTLKKLGIDSYSIGNICRCRPTTDEGENRTPTPGEIRKCGQFIIQEAKDYELVVLLGNTAVQGVLGKGDVGSLAGNLIVKDNKRYLVAYHPAYILRKGGQGSPEYKEWEKDLYKVKQYFYGTLCKKPIIIGERNFDRIVNLLNQEELLYVDIETTSLDIYEFKIVSIGIATEEDEFVLPYKEEYVDKLSGLFNGNKVLVIHNALFDLTRMLAKGIKVGCKVVDTMIVANWLDEVRGRSFTYGLKDLARTVVEFKYGCLVWDYDGVEEAFVYLYNAEDLRSMREVYRTLWPRLTELQKSSMLGFMSDALFVVSEMELEGMQVDLDGVEAMKKKISGMMDILQVDLKMEFGEVNWNSNIQLAELLTKFKVDTGLKTPTGRMKLDDEALSALVNVIENEKVRFLLESVLKYRKLGKLYSTYLVGVISKVRADGRVRGDYSFVTARTGRMSSSNPNLQNIPVDSKIRNLFVAKEGCVLIEGDCSQIELRVAAVLANELVMIDALKKEKDLHRLTASRILGIPEERVTSNQRQAAKAVNFGFLYGAGWRTFLDYARNEYKVNLSEKQAQEYRSRFFELYQGLSVWHKNVEEFVRANGYVESPFGRRRRLYEELGSLKDEVVAGAIRQAINSPVQGAASDLNLMIMGTLFKAREKLGRDSFTFVGTVHDSMLLEVKQELVSKVVRLIKRSVKEVENKLSWLLVPIEVDLKIGDKWGSLKEVES